MKGRKRFIFAALLGTAGGMIAYLSGKQRTKQQNQSGQAVFIDKEKKQIKHKPGFYEKYIKRPQDFCCALLAIIVLSPIMVVVAVMVRLKLGSPVIFKQERPGLNGQIFTLYKFRTMTDKKDAQGNLLPDEERLTRFGKILRSTSLDELPELFNILNGDSGIIGTTKKNLDFTRVSLA